MGSTISTLTVSRLKCASVKSLIFKMKILLLLLVTAAFVAARAEKLECYIGEPSQNQTKQCTNDDDVCLTEYRGTAVERRDCAPEDTQEVKCGNLMAPVCAKPTNATKA